MNLSINLIENDQDYRDGIAIRNIDLDFTPITVEDARNHDATMASDLVLHRLLGRDSEGKPRAMGYVREDRIPDGKLFMIEALMADWRALDEWCEMADAVEAHALQLGATTVIGSTRSNRQATVDAYIARGYALSQRNPLSFLDVQRFDASSFMPSVEKARADGFILMSVTDYVASNSEWQRPFWRLIMDLAEDIPMPVPFVEEPFDEFKKWMDSPVWKSDTRFVALDGEELIGISEYDIRSADPTIAATYLTGVRREYRRKGLATALKTLAISDAKSKDVLRLFTDNEENNPMFGLNVALGFKKAFDWMVFRKKY